MIVKKTMLSTWWIIIISGWLTTCGTTVDTGENADQGGQFQDDEDDEEEDFDDTTIIPGGLYRGNPDDIMTFGVSATVVASTETSAEAVYGLVKSVFKGFDAFKTLHPAFKKLKKEHMIVNGLSAPLHQGAVKYYREAGLM